ncbi:hypothetical protein CES85_5242 [Ochrobactrum quorumnocens]|uniref:Uncharacterized protein n=1 Tax=Ochrobactrum quorumnocens TaxID=271865 RepID=A0A248UCM3_9HYPH|nr:hypothetical protein CES85_5242 [[Ochrobactrum] quorumnocens]
MGMPSQRERARPADMEFVLHEPYGREQGNLPADDGFWIGVR